MCPYPEYLLSKLQLLHYSLKSDVELSSLLSAFNGFATSPKYSCCYSQSIHTEQVNAGQYKISELACIAGVENRFADRN